MTLESWNTNLQIASAILLGVTFVVGAAATLTSLALNRRQNREVAEAKREASVAIDTAGKAHERAAKLELEAAQQREKAAIAEKALLELQQKIADRVIAPDKREAVIAALAAAKGDISVS